MVRDDHVRVLRGTKGERSLGNAWGNYGKDDQKKGGAHLSYKQKSLVIKYE